MVSHEDGRGPKAQSLKRIVIFISIMVIIIFVIVNVILNSQWPRWLSRNTGHWPRSSYTLFCQKLPNCTSFVTCYWFL